MIVGDGTAAFHTPARPYIQLFKWNGTQYVGPKVLAYHRSTFNNQRARGVRRTAAHLRSDALYAATHASCAAVLYTSDLMAYSNMYLVEIGNFDTLPDLE